MSQNNLIRRGLHRFTPIATANFGIAGGAAGWIDTDVSATTGTDTSKLWVVVCKNDAFQDSGARAHGSAIDCKVANSNSVTLLSYVDTTGHMDLYRAAANAGYYFIGYIQ